MKENGYDATVLTALDEISWLFNLKGGSDIPHSPMFYSYAIVTLDEGVKLYIYPEKQTNTVKEHLNAWDCKAERENCVELRGEYFSNRENGSCQDFDLFFLRRL